MSHTSLVTEDKYNVRENIAEILLGDRYVETVNEVSQITASVTEAPAQLVAGINLEFSKSVGKLEDHLSFLINLNKILSINEKEKINTYSRNSL
jgi:chemotaxis signal transduction protein